MATTTDIRRAPANPRYRYLNEDELVEGAQALMVDIDSEWQTQHPPAGTIVTLDPDPQGDRDGTPYVYYHCTRPAWEGQCFVSVERFTTGYADRDDWPVPGPRHEFWVPLDLSKL